MEIPRITLSDNTTIPQIGLGTWKVTGDECQQMIAQALESGYNHIDTALRYGNHEDIAKVLYDKNIPREQLYLTSKVWQDDLSYQGVIEQVNKALAELHTEYLDLVLVHWPNKEFPMEDTFSALNDLADEGRIKSIGVSNFTTKHLRKAMEVSDYPITVNQVEFHPHLFQQELLAFCEEHDIVIEAYSPNAHGHILKDTTLAEIAEKHNVSIPQVSLKWMMDKGIVVIPKASSKEHLEDNLQAINLNLDETDHENIDSIEVHERTLHPSFAEFDD